MSIAQQILAEVINDPEFVKRFWAKVDRLGLGECWPWLGPLNSSGYGIIGARRQLLQAHRVSYAIAYGIPSACVCHHCDFRPCCNPEHFFHGSLHDNIQDMLRKGRNHRGEKTGGSKLTDEDVVAIRDAYSKGMRSPALSLQYGVNRTTICHVLRRSTWSHIK